MAANDRTEVLWFSEALRSAERCVILDRAGAAAITGTAILPMADIPAAISYEVDTETDWSTSAARISIAAGVDSRVIVLERREHNWFVDGAERPDLAACTSVDLGWSPATNTPPLRAAMLGRGGSVASTAAWLRFPELDFVASEQTYTRLADDQVRYTSTTFTAELTTTPAHVVTIYGQDLWRAATIRRGK